MPLASVLPVLLTEELSGRCPETREGRLPLDPRRGGPLGIATPIFSFSLSLLEPKSLRMIILTIMLVQVLCYHSIIKITRNGINSAMFVTECFDGPFWCLAREREKSGGCANLLGCSPQLVLTHAYQFGLIMFSDFPMLELFGGLNCPHSKLGQN